METLTLIIYQVLFENILDEVYEVLVNIILKYNSNSCGININLSDEVWLITLIQFEVLSKHYPFYSQVANMVNVVIHSQ